MFALNNLFVSSLHEIYLHTFHIRRIESALSWILRVLGSCLVDILSNLDSLALPQLHPFGMKICYIDTRISYDWKYFQN